MRIATDYGNVGNHYRSSCSDCAVTSIADGASSSVSEQISGMGSSYLTVRITDDKEKPLRLSNFPELLDNEEIAAAAPVGKTSVTAKTGYTSGSMSITGTTGSYFDIMNLAFSSGRALKKADLDNQFICSNSHIRHRSRIIWESRCRR